MRYRLAHDQRGLTLVEMMASLLVFALITLGVVPLLVSSLQGAALARNLTLGKALAQEAMERARGLPYYKAFDDQRTNAGGAKTREDLLDMFFPCASTDAAACPGYSATPRTVAPLGTIAAHTHLTTCLPTSTFPGCATHSNEDYTIYYVAEFKAAAGTSSQTVIPPNSPGANYAWDASGRDSPPSQLLQLTITVASQVGARVKTFKLESLFGDRKFGTIAIAGSASVDYGIQVETSFVDLLGDKSILTATGGSARSYLEQRLVSTASQDVTAGELRLVKQVESENPVPLDGTPKYGASIVGLSAPPSSTPAAVPTGPQTASHPSLAVTGPTAVASFLDTSVGGPAVGTTDTALRVDVSNELPRANGGFNFTQPGDAASGFFWVQNQADTGSDAQLKLDSTRKLLSLRADAGGRTLYGRTNGTTGALGTADRKVELSAQVTIEEFRLFPVTFIPGANPRRSVMFIDDFVASVTCRSAPGSGISTGTWSASLRVWVDPLNDGATTTTGANHVVVPIGVKADGTFEARDLRTILSQDFGVVDGNPLVYDSLVDLNDVYLFKETLKNGYLDEAGFAMKAPASTTTGGGTATSADVDQAIGITTVPTNATLPESGLRISMGKIRCESLDAR